MDVHTAQKAVTEFLTAKGSSPIEIYELMRNLNTEDATFISSVRCGVARFKNG